MRCKICGKPLKENEEEVCFACDEYYYSKQAREREAEMGKKYFRATRNIFRTRRDK